MASPAQPAFRPWVLLLVDDEPDVLASTRTLLEASIASLKVITAPSGRAGLDLLARERVDLVLADFRMPGMDGIEFLYQCCRRHPTVPRAMFSAFATEQLAGAAFQQALVAGFVSKGADPAELVADVARLLEYHPSSAPPPPPVHAPGGSLLAADAAPPPPARFPSAPPHPG